MQFSKATSRFQQHQSHMRFPFEEIHVANKGQINRRGFWHLHAADEIPLPREFSKVKLPKL